METADVSAAAPLPVFRQPKPWMRWSAVALALAGWCISLGLLLISGGLAAKPLMELACGGHEKGNCASVLTQPQAYVALWSGPGAPRLPVAAFGMAYFAFVGLWYLFVGPPTHNRRFWHLVILAVVGLGVWSSLRYIGIMRYELHQWCAGCLTAHAINGLLLALTLLAWPWRRPAVPPQPHPGFRLALATIVAGLLGLTTHLAAAYSVLLLGSVQRQSATYAAVLNDPEFVRWDFNRQPAVDLPIYADEVFAGSPDAPNTVVVFGDFYCPHCRQAHEALVAAATRHPGRTRVAFRYYPQDPECNSNPDYRSGGHPSACRAARAAEAARRVGGRDAYLAMRAKLWAEQARLPDVPSAQQSAAQRRLFEDWAAELGMDRRAFTAAMDSPEVASRIAADIHVAERLGQSAMPVIYLNGKLLRGWSNAEVWDALLGGSVATITGTASQPASQAGTVRP